MSESSYKRKFEFQNKMISRQSEQIAELKSQIHKLELKCEEKDKIIQSVSFLKDELTQSVSEVRRLKEEYKSLIQEIRKMKEIMNQTVYKGRWKLIRFLMK